MKALRSRRPSRPAAMAAGIVCALAGTSAWAQPFATPPPPAAPRPFAIAVPTDQTLTNGLRVIVARREGVPIVSAVLIALSGSEADPPRLAGLASLSAGLMTEGTRRHTAPELAAAAEALGGSIDSGAGWNQARVSMTVTTPKLDAALALMNEVATEPTFAPEEIERQRTQTLDELKVAYAEPPALASLVAQRLVYGDGPYGHPAGGTPESIARIQRDDLVAMHRAAFRPDHAVLILSGDIDAKAGLALARKHFGAWAAPARKAMATSPPAAVQQATQATTALLDMGSTGQAAVVVALALPAQSSADRLVGAVVNAALGGNYSSRLNEEIRVKRGLSYGASSGLEARGDGALFRAAIETKNESAPEVVRLTQSEMDKFAAEPLAADELAARKAALIGGFSRSVETTAGLAGAIAALVITHRSPAELKTRIDRLEAVSAADVQRYATTYLGAPLRRVVAAGDASAFASALQAERPGSVVIAQKTLALDRPGSLVVP